MTERSPGGNDHRRPDRYIRLGVSHPSEDPARHRVFEIRASYSAAVGGWVAQVGEQNLNEQLVSWGATPDDDARPTAFPTAAACLGDAVALVVDTVDREARDEG